MDEPKFLNTDYADFADFAVNCENEDWKAGGSGLLHRDITGAAIGGMYVVHKELGSGFLEGVYANALTAVLRGAGLLVEREVVFEIVFHGERVGCIGLR
jgi:hypothetical protein